MKILSILFLCSIGLLPLCQVAFGQQPTTSTSASLGESSDRIKDRLIGPVRRVRVETAKLIYKDGSTQEGPRQPKSMTTYDVVGRRVDATSTPPEQQTVSGKEEFRYDSRNNVVEMTLRSEDGALLSKEVYEYEFDELGNWRKMIRSIAVYENGKVGLEPIEVTYRNITYYFDQSVAKLTPATPKTEALPKTQPAPKPEVTTAASEPTKQPNVTDASSSNVTSGTQPAAAPTEVKEAAPTVVQVSEDTLRKAVVELPQPEYPATLRNAGIGGKVEVQFLIDEKGEVSTLRPISGNPLLTEATAIAWRKARFSTSKLSKQPAHVIGVLSYEFTADPKRSKPSNAEREASSSEKVSPSEATTVKAENTAKANASATTPPPVDPAAADKLRFATPFEKGLASLNSLQYQAAVDFFKQAIYANPNDALAYYKLGLAYSAVGSHKETIVAYQQAIKLARVFANADSYYRLGNAYSALNDYAAAIEPLKQSLYMIRAQTLENGKNQPGDPSESDVHFALGLAYYGTASFRNAVKEFKDAVKLNPNFASAHYGLGLAYLGYGDKRGAQKAEEALKKLKSPLANKLTDALLLPGVQKNRVF